MSSATNPANTMYPSVIPKLNLGKFGPASIQWLLIALLVLSFADGLVSGFYEARHAISPLWWDAIALLSTVAIMLSWYHQDSNLRHYQRHIVLNIVILGAAVIGIPYYLIKSREKGKKLIAIGWLLAYTSLFFLISIGGEGIALALAS